MALLAALLLPIVLSAVAVWIASAVGWMFVGHHANDTQTLPNEPATLDTLRSCNIPPGQYSFPFMRHNEGNTPEGREKWIKGPAGMLTVFSMPNMGKNMGLSFLIYLVVSFLIAYVAGEVLPRGSSFGKVMQVVGTMGILSYCFAFLPCGVWFQMPKRAMLTNFIDGVVFGLITGAVFAAMWPKA